MSEELLRAFVDRIEGDVAVLLIGEDGHPANIPVCYLPENVEEGMVVNIRFEADPEATREARERTAGLMERLRRKSS